MHKLESESSQDKGQKWHVQINSPGKFPSAFLPSLPFPQHASGWEEIDQRGLIVVIYDPMKIAQN